MGSLSPNIGLTLPTIGGDTGPLFAQEINGDLSIIDGVCGGVNSLSVAGNANVTLTTPQAQNLIQQFTGALTGNVTVFLPAAGRFYAIENATTGNFSLSVGCLGGSNVQSVPQGLSTWIWTDGTYTRLSNPPGWQEITTYSVSASASQAILLPAPFRRFRLTLQSILIATSAVSLQLQTSTNGGSSFTSTGYHYAFAPFRSDGSSGLTGNNAAASIVVTGASNTFSTYDATIEIFPGSSSGGVCLLRVDFVGTNSSNQFQVGIVGGASTDRGVNAIQLFPSTGTFSGTIIVEGLP